MPLLLHPAFVHFPIALLCTAALWDLIRQSPTDQAITWRLWCLGTAAAVLASTVGIYEYLPHRRSALAHPLMQHQLWGLGVTVCALSWAMWRGYCRHLGRPDPAHAMPGRLLSLLIGAGVLVAASGGGNLVLEHGAALIADKR